jgi:two-component system heavy metal sensor histidine kinase CusS
MFWKKDDAASKGPLAGGHAWSLAGRLTLLVTLSFICILCLVTLYLYISMRKNISHADKDFLANEIAHLRTIIADNHSNSQSLVKVVMEEVRWEAQAQTSTMYYARVLDHHGKILVETEHMQRIFPPEVFPPPLEVWQKSGEVGEWKSGRGKTFELESAWAGPVMTGGGGKGYLIQVALDISHENKILFDYRRRMAMMLFIGTLFSIVICVVVVRSGTRPVKDIVQTIHRISAEQLHERIGQTPWPKELSVLAVAFDSMLERLEESFRRLSRFSADIAHELRTPVNGLMGTAEVILSKERSPEEYRKVIEASMEEYARLSRMIEGLLFLARAENEEISIERSCVDVYKEMENIRDLYDAIADEAGVEVICRADPVEVNAEPVLLQRAIANLLANALQYTPRGGRVILSAEKLPNESVNISVSDTGSGIPVEHQPRVFDRFYRLDPSRCPQTTGTGLGLAIVRSIMELHGGTTSIRSAVNQGTTITLNFPSAK